MPTPLAELVRPRKAVLFDLFHTLVQVRPEGPERLTTAEILGIDRAEWNRLLWEDTHERLVGIDRDPHSIIRKIAHRIDSSISEEKIDCAVRSRLERFARALREVPPPSLRALERLQAAGKKIGLVSNADVTEIVAWPTSPLAPFFDAAIFSCDVGAKKPEAAIYNICLERLGVQASDAVFVGDGGSNELEGARAVGLTPVMMAGIIKRVYPDLIAERQAQADFVIDDPGELLV
jgi:putative hydrolase of the HAD superfamily